ncbi:UNVERIFIED_CONTAM: hypothetical protein Cloal_0899 [Acetivibrio alkalicellulosi]
MRVNFFISFVISLLLCSKIIVAASVFEQKLYYLFIIPLVFLLFTIFFKKISFIIRYVLVVPVAITYLAFVIFIILSVANYPKGDFPETNFKFVVVKEDEIDAGQYLYELLEQFDKILDESDRKMTNKNFNINLNKVSVVELLYKTREKRSEIFRFIKSNDICVYQDLSNVNIIEGENDSNKLLILVSLFNIELLEVNYYRLEGKHQEAVDKYLDIWNNIAQIVEIKGNRLIETLIYINITKTIGEYFYENQEFFSDYNLSKVTHLKESIFDGLDKSFERAFLSEFIISKKTYKKYEKAWPLFDVNKYLKKIDQFNYTLVESIKVPYDSYNQLKKLEEESNLHSVSLFHNYIGEILYYINVNMFSGLCESTVRIKNELSIYFYAMDKENYHVIPIDFVTGERIITKDFPEHIELEFTLFNKCDLYTFKIKK